MKAFQLSFVLLLNYFTFFECKESLVTNAILSILEEFHRLTQQKVDLVYFKNDGNQRKSFDEVVRKTLGSTSTTVSAIG